MQMPLMWKICTFQPTPLMRGATSVAVAVLAAFVFQPTPLMRGATLLAEGDWVVDGRVSTHAPHARGDMSSGSRPPV